MFVFAAQPLLAATAPQFMNFAESNAGNLYQGSGFQSLASPGFFSATLQPFDTSLGKLRSFTLKCELEGKLSGKVGPEGESGAVQAGMGGAFAINGDSFAGTGGGGGGMDDVFFTGEPIDVPFTIAPFEHTVLATDSGDGLNPRILDALIGTEPFTLSYSSPVNVIFMNVEDLAASFEATITLVYNFSTSAGEESLKIVSFVRHGQQQTVSIKWISAVGKTYTIEASSDLAANSWEPVQTGFLASDFWFTSFVEPVPATVTRRFYRVREEE